MQNKQIVRATVFLLLCAALLCFCQYAFIVSDNRIYQWINGFYAEPESSLDAVYVGGSNVYSFYEPALGWGHYGITVWPFCTPGQHLGAAEYMIREARKTQPDALYIVSAGAVMGRTKPADIHYLADYLPRTETRRQLIDRLADYEGIPEEERLEFDFPFIRFHTDISALTRLHRSLNGLKGCSTIFNFFMGCTDVSEVFSRVTETGELTAVLRESLDSLLEYCDEEHVNVLFVTVPQAVEDKEMLRMMNTVLEEAASRGYPVLDMMGLSEEIGIDFSTDYYNGNHTNIHGAVKVTDYLARYLTEHFGFVDKRGIPAYASWDEAYVRYQEILAPYALPFEYQDTEWEFSLLAPVVDQPRDAEQLRWSTVDGADGYGIFCRQGEGPWKLEKTVGPDSTACPVDDAPDEVYTVVAYAVTQGKTLWGRCDPVAATR